MAQNNRPKMIVGTTPRGVFKYPKLNEPDYGSKDYPVPNGQFVVRLILREADPKTQAFIKKMEAEQAKAKAVAEEKFKAMKVANKQKLKAANGDEGIKANPLYTVIYDEETEQPTGDIEFKFSMPYKVEIKKGPKAGKVLTFKPVMVDARGLPIAAGKLPPIWGGTEGIVSFEYQDGGYFIEGSGLYGVKMRLLGVQILNLVSGGERNAASLGFKQEEGDFDASALPDREDDADEDGSEDSSEDSDGQPEDF